ncbi:MAG: 3-deoxy-manno-octulosonate cytidylyltransferase [Gammaproteobacteria bacterium]|nr:3-deoxy-manno-octulosonate cytidylyltransferase [Gammaproteobacteria bacterium]
MNILCVIPSRLHSTRLPRKALLPIQGKPMVQWTYENALRASCLTDVIVATDSEEIADVIRNIGGKVHMTDSAIPTGSERVAQVAASYPEMDVIINLQGDEPFIQPYMLDTLVAPFFEDEKTTMSTLAYPLMQERYHHPGAVKVITNLKNNALYFSRSPIPYQQLKTDNPPVYNHMGVYAFRRDFLMLYPHLSPTELEKAESLEQLRVLEHGYNIRVCVVADKTLEINTPEEYALAQQFNYVV